MRRIAISVLLAATLAASSAAVVLAHSPGHPGGCEEFGRINREIGQNPAAFGFPWARNLGDIVSWFATDPAAPGSDVPGVGDIVRAFDHQNCG
ncbi:MAG TPA: hypothetical protein VNO86_05565 [Candidatus Binatia bacterium]|nr:hypothetical protein [Candidatus Binatia bacterium]